MLLVRQALARPENYGYLVFGTAGNNSEGLTPILATLVGLSSSKRLCQYVVEFARSNPHLEEYFRTTFVPEESFFHTILGNSPFRSRGSAKTSYMRIGPHHKAITLPTLNNVHMLLFEAEERLWVEDDWGSGEMLFARKFSDKNLD